MMLARRGKKKASGARVLYSATFTNDGIDIIYWDNYVPEIGPMIVAGYFYNGTYGAVVGDTTNGILAANDTLQYISAGNGGVIPINSQSCTIDFDITVITDIQGVHISTHAQDPTVSASWLRALSVRIYIDKIIIYDQLSVVNTVPITISNGDHITIIDTGELAIGSLSVFVNGDLIVSNTVANTVQGDHVALAVRRFGGQIDNLVITE